MRLRNFLASLMSQVLEEQLEFKPRPPDRHSAPLATSLLRLSPSLAAPWPASPGPSSPGQSFTLL